ALQWSVDRLSAGGADRGRTGSADRHRADADVPGTALAAGSLHRPAGRRLAGVCVAPVRDVPPVSARTSEPRRVTSSLLLEPVFRDLQRPNLAAKGLSVSPRHPDLVLEDKGGVLMALFPADLRQEPRP